MNNFLYSFHHHDSLTSTNDEAIRLASQGAAEGAVVTANFQTKGRGRDGRTWESVKGRDLLLSILLRPSLKANQAAGLTLLTAQIVQKTLKDLGVASEIKKPNDVLVQGKKIAGILTESQTKADKVEWCVVGIGLDVNSEIHELPPEATSIRLALGHTVDREKVKAELLQNFKTEYLNCVAV